MVQFFKLTFIIATVLLFSYCASKNLGRDPIDKKKRNELRVVTYNVNWGQSNWTITAPQVTSNSIRLLEGDIVLLQEATPYWYEYLKKHLSDLYPYQLFKPQGDGGGLAILSRYQVTNQKYTHSSISCHPGWKVDMKSHYGVIQVANLHLTPPLISKSNLKFGLDAYFSTPAIREQEVEYYYQFVLRLLVVILMKVTMVSWQSI